MTSWQIYIFALRKTWWILGVVILGIIGTGIYEVVEMKWEKRGGL